MSKKKFAKEKYGMDEYNIFLIVLSVVLMATGVITSREKVFGVVLMGVAVFFLIKTLLRIMSKDSEKCAEQNRAFTRSARYILNALFVKPFRTLKDGKKYKFLICPSCACLMRLPRHEGHIEIKCPACGESFMAKT